MTDFDADLAPPSSVAGDAILTTDASAEGEACAAALRAQGYHVIDVPLSLLEARAIGEVPRVIIVDVDQPGALEAVERLRELAAGSAAALVCIGHREKAAELGFDSQSPRVFERPVDKERLVEVVTELAAPLQHGERMRATTPPPSYIPRRDTSPPFRPSDAPAPVTDFPAASDPLDVEALVEPLEGTAPQLSPVAMSPELEQLLHDAEARVNVEHGAVSMIPGDDDGSILLPADLLAVLDEPLDPDDEEGGTGSGAVGTGTPLGKVTTSAGAGRPLTANTGATGPGTSPGMLPGTGVGHTTHARTNVGEPPREVMFERTPLPQSVEPKAVTSLGMTPPPSFARDRIAPPPRPVPSTALPSLGAPRTRDDLPPPTEFEPARSFGARALARSVDVFESSEPPGSRGPNTRTSGASASFDGPTPGDALLPAVLGPGDALRALARAISGRASGSLALGAEQAMRRIVLREGDVVTAASGAPDETLLAFLMARGDLERDVATRLAGKLPPFGRHAGAALIAHGHLGQDDLWPVLRAHAEWIIARAVATDEGTCEFEQEPPGRLRAEPNVFGGATGAEVIVEIARRTFSPEGALARLGGPRARLEQGSRATLVAECALRPDEDEVVRAARGRTAGEILAHVEPEIVNVLYVLAALDVFDVVVPTGGGGDERAKGGDPLDEEALRQRVRARVALVQEGDYFALLGVPRAATSYEIRRAYVELRRAFEPARLLTAATADLADDVRLVVEVLDEAFEILRDHARRERYRRAIEAGPP